jgi:hypothetical protein
MEASLDRRVLIPLMLPRIEGSRDPVLANPMDIIRGNDNFAIVIQNPFPQSICDNIVICKTTLKEVFVCP